MKNNLLKYFFSCFLLFYSIIILAAPGDGDEAEDLEGTDSPTVPIDHYVWVLVFVGLIYVFIKLRSFQKD